MNGGDFSVDLDALEQQKNKLWAIHDDVFRDPQSPLNEFGPYARPGDTPLFGQAATRELDELAEFGRANDAAREDLHAILSDLAGQVEALAVGVGDTQRLYAETEEELRYQITNYLREDQ